MLSGLKDQSPLACYFPGLFVDLSLLEYNISVMVCCKPADVFNKLYCASVWELPPTSLQIRRERQRAIAVENDSLTLLMQQLKSH